MITLYFKSKIVKKTNIFNKVLKLLKYLVKKKTHFITKNLNKLKKHDKKFLRNLEYNIKNKMTIFLKKTKKETKKETKKFKQNKKIYLYEELLEEFGRNYDTKYYTFCNINAIRVWDQIFSLVDADTIIKKHINFDKIYLWDKEVKDNLKFKLEIFYTKFLKTNKNTQFEKDYNWFLYNFFNI